MRLSVRSSSNRDLRTLAQAAPQAGGGLLERICPVEAFSIVPRSLAGGLPHTSRAPRRDGKAHSATAASRERDASLGTHAVVLETAPGQAVREVTPDARSPPPARFGLNHFDAWAIVRVIGAVARV